MLSELFDRVVLKYNLINIGPFAFIFCKIRTFYNYPGGRRIPGTLHANIFFLFIPAQNSRQWDTSPISNSEARNANIL